MRKLNWGVLGTGRIVEKGGTAITRAENSRWIGIAGRNAENSKKAAEKYGLSKVYESYDQLLADPEIDAVYIALLNHLHHEWTIKAIRAGKHVLLEKPFALNAQEAEGIHEEAQKHNIQVMEAHVWHYYPGYEWARTKIKEGKIGEVGIFRSSFHFHLAEGSTRWVREWGGGCLYDIGCYPVVWSRYFIGEEPIAAECSLAMHEEYGVDRRFSGTLYYPGNKTAQLSAAFDLTGGTSFEIVGSAGTMRFYNKVTPDRMENIIELNSDKDGSETKTWVTDRIEPFKEQVEAFAEAVLEGKPTPRGSEEGVIHMRILDALFEADRLGRRVELKLK